MTQLSRRSCHLRLALFAFASCFAIASLGCNFEVPEDGVQLIVKQELSDDQMEILKVRLERMRDEGDWQSISSITINDVTLINLSPVSDVAGFAASVDFAAVSEVDGRVLHLALDMERL